MNDIEKAIEDLRGLSDRSSIKSELFKERHGKNFNLAISALEKQIPEKVIVISSLETYCPCCDNEVINNYYYFSYCEKCGQKIDWSEVENEC